MPAVRMVELGGRVQNLQRTQTIDLADVDCKEVYAYSADCREGIGAIEHGKRNVAIDNIAKIAKPLKVVLGIF